MNGVQGLQGSLPRGKALQNQRVSDLVGTSTALAQWCARTWLVCLNINMNCSCQRNTLIMLVAVVSDRFWHHWANMCGKDDSRSLREGKGSEGR